MGSRAGKNLTAKIIALVLAAILWIYVMNEQNPPIEASFTVPVEVRNASTNLVVEDMPDTARVKLRGPRSIIAGVLTKDIKCYMDLRGLPEGRHNVKITAQVPSSLELVETTPDKATIKLDTAVSKQIPIEIRLVGTASGGAVVSRVTASNEKATVEGPKTVVESVTRVAAVVDLSGRSSDFSADVPLVVINQSGKEVQGLTVYPDKVTVKATLVKGTSKKAVDIRTLTYGELAPGFVLRNVTTEPAKIEVSGTFEQVDKLDYIYTEPINLGGINQNTTREVKLQIKEGIAASHDTVKVTIMVEAKQ